MRNRSVDLFDDPAWPTDLPDTQSNHYSSRTFFVASLVLVLVLMSSMVLPWFTSAETPPWTPFSHWLDLGWAPGTRNWGHLVLWLGILVACGIWLMLLWPSKTLAVLLLVATTGLLVVTVLEATAHLSVNPGPNLHADYGALIGTLAVGLAWIGVLAGAFFDIRR